MYTRVPVILAVVLFLIAAQSASACGSKATGVDILHVVLKDLAAEYGSFALVLESTTVPSFSHLETAESGLKSGRDQRTDIPPELWKALREENRVNFTFELLPGVGGIFLVSSSDLPLVDSSEESWTTFRDRWPELNSVVRLSKPAVSSNRREAVIFITVTRGPLDAEGILFLLRREGTAWKIILRRLLIAS